MPPPYAAAAGRGSQQALLGKHHAVIYGRLQAKLETFGAEIELSAESFGLFATEMQQCIRTALLADIEL